MKPFTLNILKGLSLPSKLTTVKASILGQPERGKTYAAGVFAEELLENDCQTIVLDSVGVWYGLRLAANGKGKGYDIHIFGGEHGDLPLVPTAGAVLAETLVRTRKSAIIDTTSFATEAEQRRFMADFAETFYRLKMRHKSRVTLVLEEADDWIPQMPEATELRMLGAFQRIARKGRNFGIGLLVISQRPQGVHKKVLNLSDVLFVFGISGKHERKAIREWTEYNEVDEETRDKALSLLPGLKVGQCLVWAPRFGIFGIHSVRKKHTFDASATPDGDEVSAAAVKPLDTDELAKAMAATVEEAKANDPKALRARVMELEAEMAKRGGRVTGKTVTKTIEVPVLGKREVKLLERVEKNVRALTDAVVSIQPVAAGVARDFEVLRTHVRGLVDAAVQERGSFDSELSARDLAGALVERKRRDPGAPDAVALLVRKPSKSSGNMRDRLTRTLEFFYPVSLTRAQLAGFVGLDETTRSFRDEIAAMVQDGLLDVGSGVVKYTESASRHLRAGAWANELSTVARLRCLAARIPKLRTRGVAILTEMEKGPATRAELAQRQGVDETTRSFRDAIAYLSGMKILDVGRGQVALGRIVVTGEN